MLDNRHELIAALNSSLVSQRYSPVVVRNYCTYASGFLDDLEQRGIPVSNVTDVQVEQYLRHAIALFKKRRGRRPKNGIRRRFVGEAAIHIGEIYEKRRMNAFRCEPSERLDKRSAATAANGLQLEIDCVAALEDLQLGHARIAIHHDQAPRPHAVIHSDYFRCELCLRFVP